MFLTHLCFSSFSPSFLFSLKIKINNIFGRKEVWQVLINLNAYIHLPYDPAILLLGINRRNENTFTENLF